MFPIPLVAIADALKHLITRFRETRIVVDIVAIGESERKVRKASHWQVKTQAVLPLLLPLRDCDEHFSHFETATNIF